MSNASDLPNGRHLRAVEQTVSSASQNDYLLDGAFDWFMITGGNGTTFTGFDGISNGTLGRVVRITNEGNVSFTLVDRSELSLFQHRIQTPDGNNYTVAVGETVTLIYNPFTFNWRIA